MAINLVFGFVATGINNAAHIGGIIIGAFLALMWYLSYVSKLKTILKIFGLLGAVIITSGFYMYCVQINSPLLPLWHEIIIQNPDIIP